MICVACLGKTPRFAFLLGSSSSSSSIIEGDITLGATRKHALLKTCNGVFTQKEPERKKFSMIIASTSDVLRTHLRVKVAFAIHFFTV